MVLLSGCAGTSCSGNFEFNSMPDFPIAGKKVAEEVKKVCKTDAECAELNDYMNRVYKFKTAYNAVKKDNI